MNDPDPLAPPLPLTQLLDQAIKRARASFRTIFPAVGVPLGLLAGLMNVVQILWMSRFVSLSASDPLRAMTSMLGLYAILFVFGLVYAAGYMALTVAAVDSVAGRPVDMGRAWTLLLQPRNLGTVLLKWLILIAGSFLCCLPGIYAGLVLAFVVPVIAQGEATGTEALHRSHDLARFNPRGELGSDPRFSVFVVAVVGWILSSAATMIIQLPLAAVQQVMMVRSLSSGEHPDPAALVRSTMWIQVPGQVVSFMITLAVQTFAVFALALLFFDVERRKEGAGLATEIDRLAAEPSGEGPV